MNHRVLAYRIAASAAALVLLAACGSDKKDTASTSATPVVVSTPAATPAPDASGAPSSDTSAAKTVNVSLTEYKIGLDTSTFTAGTYTFTASNDGKYPHGFQIDGPGVQDKGSGTIQPGDTGTLTVTLQKGSYDFYCPVPGHKDKGMDQKVTVTGS
jgi:uncharacterized cupredoxin-like copper-binding protein